MYVFENKTSSNAVWILLVAKITYFFLWCIFRVIWSTCTSPRTKKTRMLYLVTYCKSTTSTGETKHGDKSEYARFLIFPFFCLPVHGHTLVFYGILNLFCINFSLIFIKRYIHQCESDAHFIPNGESVRKAHSLVQLALRNSWNITLCLGKGNFLPWFSFPSPCVITPGSKNISYFTNIFSFNCWHNETRQLLFFYQVSFDAANDNLPNVTKFCDYYHV